MKKVKIHLTGYPTREVYIRDYETLLDLTMRIGTETWGSHRVDHRGWWCDDHRIKDSSECMPRDGEAYFATEAVRGSRGRTREPSGAIEVRVLLTGFGGSMTFSILDDEYLGDFLSRASLPKFPMFRATRYFIRDYNAAKGHEIHNPGHFVLKPGMSLVFEGARERLDQFLLEEKMKKEGWQPPRNFSLVVNGEAQKCSFTPQETLADFLARCPITACDARRVRTWKVGIPGANYFSSDPETIHLHPSYTISGSDNQ